MTVPPPAAASPAQHWDAVYGTRALDEVSWYQEHPATSLRLLTGAVPPDAPIVDVGAGAGRLVDALLEQGWTDLTLLDVSAEALAAVRDRLGQHAAQVELVAADLLSWRPARSYAGWHDRAVFHFLTSDADRAAYVELAAGAVRPGGVVVLGTFAPDGPEQCSGLPTRRSSADELAALFAPGFTLVTAEREEHRTPAGVVQPFTWVVLRRVGEG